MLPPVQQKASTRHNCVSRARHTHTARHRRPLCLGASPLRPRNSHNTPATSHGGGAARHTRPLGLAASPLLGRNSHNAQLTRRAHGAAPPSRPLCLGASPLLGRNSHNAHTHTAEGKKSQVPCLAIDVYWHASARTWLGRLSYCRASPSLSLPRIVWPQPAWAY